MQIDLVKTLKNTANQAHLGHSAVTQQPMQAKLCNGINVIDKIILKCIILDYWYSMAALKTHCYHPYFSGYLANSD